MKRWLFLLFLCPTILFSSLISPAAAQEPLAALQTSDNGSPYYIMVNRQKNTVTIYTVGEDGFYSIPYKAMICSTGRPYHTTPTGTFTITNTKKRWCYMLDGTYGQYSTQFYGHYLFHSVCYRTANQDALLTEEYNLLGQVASLGCIRVQTEDAKWIYDHCPAGTKVTVYDSPDPGPLGTPSRRVDVITPELENGWDPTDPHPNNPWTSQYPEVVSPSPTTELTIYPVPETLPVGVAAQLDVYWNTPDTVTLPSITWTSSHPEIASIDAEGRVIAQSEGTTELTASCGQISTTISLSVYGTLLPYTDLVPGSWYYGYARFAWESGLLSGISDTLFSPHSGITRSQLVHILYRLNGSPSSETTLYYEDVQPDDWFYDAACWNQQYQIIPHVDPSLFAPDTYLTREEVALALYQYERQQSGLPLPSTQTLEQFVDASEVSSDAWHAVCWAVDSGYLSGTDTKTLLPHAPVSRIQLAVILQQFYTNLQTNHTQTIPERGDFI